MDYINWKPFSTLQRKKQKNCLISASSFKTHNYTQAKIQTPSCGCDLFHYEKYRNFTIIPAYISLFNIWLVAILVRYNVNELQLLIERDSYRSTEKLWERCLLFNEVCLAAWLVLNDHSVLNWEFSFADNELNVLINYLLYADSL